MLHTTPESLNETQPLIGVHGGLVLTADARLDNRDELCSLLRAPRSLPDAELILAAYERWGETCPEHLLGDFAFAVWDGRRRALFCARDHFGVKPFFYHHRSGRLFAFASEIKGLLALPDVPRRLNEVRVADYLLPLLEDKEITFYEEIIRLPPAHWMWVSREGVRQGRYWALDPEREIRMKSDAEYAEAFRELLTQAVRCRLRSALPVGSMLSGGLDSSSIACVARRLFAERGPAALPTFSLIFSEEPECDEREYIEAVVREGGVEPHYVDGDRLSPLADLERVLEHEDEPFYAPNLFMHWALYRAANKQAVRVLLDGIDGDTTVSHSVVYLSELARARRWRLLSEEVKGLARHLQQSPWTILWRHVLRPLTPSLLRQIRQRFRGRGILTLSERTLKPEFVRRVGMEERKKALLQSRATPPRTASEDHWRRLTSGLVPFVLEVADRAAAAFSIEPRYPFFDVRLAEFCLAIPAQQKLAQGWTRMVMRRAMAGILPPEIEWRAGKADLSPKFVRSLLAAHRGLLEDLLLVHPEPIARFVSTGGVGRALERYVTSGSEQDAFAVWGAATLAAWLRTNPKTQQQGEPMEPDSKVHANKTVEQVEVKKPYVTPELTVHGTVEEITKNIGTKGSDGLTGSTLT
jgi:asparagine synthase (glutamine-hydrolysing)